VCAVVISFLCLCLMGFFEFLTVVDVFSGLLLSLLLISDVPHGDVFVSLSKRKRDTEAGNCCENLMHTQTTTPFVTVPLCRSESTPAAVCVALTHDGTAAPALPEALRMGPRT
jgi:hypothetical protein